MTMFHRTFIAPHGERIADDFGNVWAALHRFVTGAAVYTEDYTTDDPHYLYSPGGTLLLSPLGVLPQGIGRNALLLADAVGILLAVALLLLLVGRRLTGPVLPVALFLVFATESVTNTLVFTNVNGVLFLLQVIFLWLLLVDRGEAVWRILSPTGTGAHTARATGGVPWAGILAGVSLGLAITVKPQFLVLLFLPLVRRQWTVLVSGIAVPVVVTAVGWVLVPDIDNYVDVLLPYLGEVRDFANASIPGFGAHYGWPGALVLALQAVAAVCVAVTVLGLLWWRDSDPFMWAATTTGILLTGVFLVSSLGQMYYSMLILPMFFTVLCRRSVMHTGVIWFGVYFCLSFDNWKIERWPDLGEKLHYSLGSVGWAVLLVVSTVTVLGWLAQRRRSGLDIGPGALVRDLLRPGRQDEPERARTDGDSPVPAGTSDPAVRNITDE